MEKFIKFLEDNNAWENFERAFIEQKNERRRVQKRMQGVEKLRIK